MIKRSVDPETPWGILLRLRWLLGAAISIAFAAGQLLETLLFESPHGPSRTLADIVVWGFLGGLAVWASMTWASRKELQHQQEIEQVLRQQRELNSQLARANQQLALLSEVNRHLADSTSLDEILSAAITFPCRLVSARAAALILYDSAGALLVRSAGLSRDELAALQEALRFEHLAGQQQEEREIHTVEGVLGRALRLPLFDARLLIGRVDLYGVDADMLADDELLLLQTIAGEIAEAITSSRRRSREERALYELEQAILEERARIARDIHDGLAQSLAFRRMRVDLWLDWLESDRERLREELKGLKAILREQIAELRRAIFALRPLQFDELGFSGGLQRYIQEFAAQQGWDLQLDLSGLPASLTPQLEANCFRIIQEALTNTAKHAQATQVVVVVACVDEGLHIRIRDNGRGFDPAQQIQDGAFQVGLRQMRERLRLARGQLTILSEPGAGTELRVWLPLPQGDAETEAIDDSNTPAPCR